MWQLFLFVHAKQWLASGLDFFFHAKQWLASGPELSVESFYSLLSASIGFRLAALMDGRIPNTMPISIENATLRIIAGTDIDTGVAVTREMTCDRIIPTATPITPPMLVRTADSVRNWKRIVLFLAPIAFFRPISEVLSVTDTSIIFMTPIPPTSSAMLATQIRRLLVLALSSCLFLAFSRRSSAR